MRGRRVFGQQAITRERSSEVSEKVESTEPADAAQNALAAELDRLRQRRDRLEIEVKNDRGMIGDGVGARVQHLPFRRDQTEPCVGGADVAD